MDGDVVVVAAVCGDGVAARALLFDFVGVLSWCGMADNEIGVDGAAAIGDALKSNTTVTKLLLDSTCIVVVWGVAAAVVVRTVKPAPCCSASALPCARYLSRLGHLNEIAKTICETLNEKVNLECGSGRTDRVCADGGACG